MFRLVLAAFLGIALPFSTAGIAESGGAPITIESCSPYLVHGTSLPGDRPWRGFPPIQITGASAGIQIRFTNRAHQTARAVTFAVEANGKTYTIRDVGTFSPGATIAHRYSNGAGQSYLLPQIIPPRISCSVKSVEFADGSIWAPSPQALR